ncbi:hypothetical protein AN958_11137 [Leucoagaricus sp. SymC.cos]|nr:hypothetical protein AN958_11137 [Leucoagaricus sp. SymC.cos]
MIPFGVKILWFVLSLTGLISSWMVFIPFGSAVGAMWVPAFFCVGNTILQGMFCLGIIWKMNPFLMPRGFCVAQALMIGFGTFVIAGTTGAISIATSLAVLRPRGYGENVPLKWRNIFLVPVVIFPILASVAHTIVVVKFDSAKPTDDLHCDSSDPEWTRFLSYAGVPFIVSLPCIFISIKSLVVVWKANQEIQRRKRSLVFESVCNYINTQPRFLKHGKVSILIKDPEPPTIGYQASLMATTPISAMTSSQSFVTANEYPPSPQAGTSPTSFMLAGRVSPVERKLHLPFRPSLAGTPTMNSLMEERRKRAEEEELEEEDISDILPTLLDYEACKRKDEARGRREHSTEDGDDESETVWARPGAGGDDMVSGQDSRAATQQRMSRVELRDDDSDVLEEIASGDVTSGRNMIPMELISQSSEFIPLVTCEI